MGPGGYSCYLMWDFPYRPAVRPHGSQSVCLSVTHAHTHLSPVISPVSQESHLRRLVGNEHVVERTAEALLTFLSSHVTHLGTSQKMISYSVRDFSEPLSPRAGDSGAGNRKQQLLGRGPDAWGRGGFVRDGVQGVVAAWPSPCRPSTPPCTPRNPIPQDKRERPGQA